MGYRGLKLANDLQPAENAETGVPTRLSLVLHRSRPIANRAELQAVSTNVHPDKTGVKPSRPATKKRREQPPKHSQNVTPSRHTGGMRQHSQHHNAPCRAQDWERTDVSMWEYADDETIGSHDPRWLINYDSEPPQRWLFKTRKHRTDDQENYDDYTEVVAYLLAKRLGIPAAEARLARYVPTPDEKAQDGVILRDLSQPTYQWLTGAEHLGSRGTPVERETRKGHSIQAIMASLQDIDAPCNDLFPQDDAQGVFVSYLLLDALIGNQDRHEENWAILTSLTGTTPHVLAPSYDHGASMAFNLSDEKIQRLLDNKHVEKFARRAKATRFELPDACKKADLMEVVRLAAVEHPEPCRALRAVTSRLHVLLDQDIGVTLGLSATKMSQARATFIGALVSFNARRAVDELSN